MKYLLFLLMVFSASLSAGGPCPEYYESNDFCYPLGSASPILINHLEHGTSRGGRYTSTHYHLGTDIDAEYGDPVWPVTFGTIIATSEGGWSRLGHSDNFAIIVKHQREDGTYFVALYGHLQAKYGDGYPKVGDTVQPRGGPLGTIGKWYTNQDHLHFSIWDNATTASTPYGRKAYTPTNQDSDAPWPSSFGHANPIAFLESNKPLAVEYFMEGRVGWFPANRTCDDAYKWALFNTDKTAVIASATDDACDDTSMKSQ